MDTSPTVLSVRTTAGGTAAAGGGFTLANGQTLTCTGTGAVAGSTTCVTYSGTSGNSATLVADCIGSTTTNTTSAAANTSTGTLNITGNCTGGNGSNRRAVLNSGTGTIAVTGNVTGGSGSVSAYGLINSSTGTITITGNVTGGSAGYGVNNSSSGTITITGTVTGGSDTTVYGLNNATSGPVNITGDLIPASASAVFSAAASVGRIYVNGNLQSVSTGRAAYGSGIFVVHPSNTVTHAYRDWNGSAVGAERVLSTGGGTTPLAQAALGARSIGTY